MLEKLTKWAFLVLAPMVLIIVYVSWNSTTQWNGVQNTYVIKFTRPDKLQKQKEQEQRQKEEQLKTTPSSYWDTTKTKSIVKKTREGKSVKDIFASQEECTADNTVYWGTVTPKCASNKMDEMVVQLFNLTYCNSKSLKNKPGISGATYCFKKTPKPEIEKSLRGIFPRAKLCNYLGTHFDYGITEIPPPSGVRCVRKLTMLRNPVKRLQSAIVYAGGSSLDFIKDNLLYAGDNHMTRIVAGQSRLCRTLPKTENGSEILRLAKYNLEHEYDWFGILERFEESFRLLGYNDYGMKKDVVQPHQKSGNGKWFSEKEILTMRRYFELDIALYDFAVELLDKRLEAFNKTKRL